ncbi:MAG: tetratricopeptide repeat protein [Planctomycetaceae bacterium]
MNTATKTLDEAVRFHEVGDFARSESLCREILRVDPSHRDALYLSGIAAVAQHRVCDALERFGRLAELCPNSPDVHARLGEIHRQSGNPPEAVAAWWRAVECNPDDPQLVNDLGIALQETGEPEAAAACFQRAMELQPSFVSAVHNLAVLLETLGRRAEALTVLRDALSCIDDANLHCTLGVLMLRDGHTAEAVRNFQVAAKVDPGCTTAHVELGRRLMAEDALATAEFHLRTAVRLDAGNGAAHVLLGRTLVLLHRSDEALPVLQRGVELVPGVAEAHTSLGHALRDAGRLDEAAEAYRRALSIDPASIETRFLFARTLLELERFEEAAAEFQQLADADVHAPQLHFYLGNALKGQGRFDDAERAYRRDCEIDPDATRSLYELGNVHRHRHEYAEARECYESVLQRKPDDFDVLIALGNVLKTLDEQQEAAATYRKVLQLIPEQPRWELWLATLCPAVFDGNDAIDAYRATFLENIDRIREMGPIMQPADVSGAACPVPYNLQFHGRDDLRLKRAYASLFAPSFDPGEAPVNQGRPRVGVVVTAGHEGVFLRFLGGVLQGLSLREFDLHVLCAASGRDRIRDFLKRDEIVPLTMPARFDAAAQMIRDARFDVLYHWEVGSDVTNYFLPFFRLAGVQCTACGVPVTSGTPCTDYFLSTGAAEPAAADTHYSERLIRAETLLTCQPRMPLPPVAKTRADFGFRPDQHVYFCPHKIEKFHPDMDPLFAEVLRRDEQGTLVIPSDRHDCTAPKLRARMSRQMPDVIDRVQFVPYLPFDDYLALTAAADVLLDPLHYGGGLTLYDGFSLNKATVTLPGRFVRGRYCAAMYELMGVDECVATDSEDYATRAVRFGNNAEYRRHVELQIAAASDVLFDNRNAVHEHEAIFERLIAESRQR